MALELVFPEAEALARYLLGIWGTPHFHLQSWSFMPKSGGNRLLFQSSLLTQHNLFCCFPPEGLVCDKHTRQSCLGATGHWQSCLSSASSRSAP